MSDGPRCQSCGKPWAYHRGCQELCAENQRLKADNERLTREKDERETVCDQWKESYVTFMEDMGPRPKGMTLERRAEQTCTGIKDAEIERLRVIIEIIMTQHWDMIACPCWICRMGCEAGCHPREEHLRWRGTYAFAMMEEEK